MKNINRQNYIALLVDNYPHISSGRKNYERFERRIEKNIFLTKKMIKCKDINEFITKIEKLKEFKNIKKC